MARKHLAHNSFQLYLPFYFYFSVTEGKDITFLYQLATFWQMPITSKQLACYFTFWFTLKMVTAVCTKTVEQLDHTVWLNPKS